MCAHENEPQDVLAVNVTDIEGSALLSCEDSLALSLVTPRATLERRQPRAQLTTGPADCQDVDTLQAQTSNQKYYWCSISQQCTVKKLGYYGKIRCDVPDTISIVYIDCSASTFF